MTIGDGLKLAITQIKKSQITSATIDAEVILSFASGKSKEFLYAHPEYKLTKIQENKLKLAIKRRCHFEPVAYITNHKEFYGLDFYVNQNVLVPRPETELLIDKAIELAKNKKLIIADIGTGSGAIAITLAKYLPKAKIIATDKSLKALQVAKINAHEHKVKIKFAQGDLLCPLKPSGVSGLTPIKNKRIDLIVANLPYLLNSDKESKNLKHEPSLALYGGTEGFELYLKLFQQIIKYKIHFEYLICEIDPRYAVRLKSITKKYFPKSKLELKKDLGKLNRILIIKSPA